MRFKLFSWLTAFTILLAFTVSSPATEPPLVVEPEKVLPDIPELETLPETDFSDVEVQDGRGGIIKNIEFVGGSVFSVDELVPLIRPIVNQPYNATVLDGVVSAITEKYKSRGYPLSFAMVRKGDLSEEKIKITLVEGYVARMEVEIDNPKISSRVKNIIRSIFVEKPLTQKTLERKILLIKRTSGYRLRFALPKPKSLSGATTLKVVEESRQTFDVSTNINKRTDDGTDMYLLLKAQSFHEYIDTVTFGGLIPTNNERDEEFYSVGVKSYLFHNGLSLKIDASQYRTNDKSSLVLLDEERSVASSQVRQKFNMDVNYPIILSSKQEWNLGGGVYVTDEDQKYRVDFMPGLNIDIFQDVDYSAMFMRSSWQQASQKGFLFLRATAKQGVDLGYTNNAMTVMGTKTEGAGDTYFTSVSVDAIYRRTLTESLSATLRGNYFFSEDTLLAAEQVTYGGSYFGRGYPESQAVGDKGYAASLELAYRFSLQNDYLKQISPYIVVDAAHTDYSNNRITHSLASGAVGVNFANGKLYKVGLEYARPLDEVNRITGERSKMYSLNISWQL